MHQRCQVHTSHLCLLNIRTGLASSCVVMNHHKSRRPASLKSEFFSEHIHRSSISAKLKHSTVGTQIKPHGAAPLNKWSPCRAVPAEEKLPGVALCGRSLSVKDRCWCCSLRSLRQQWRAIVRVLDTQVIHNHHGTCSSTWNTHITEPHTDNLWQDYRWLMLPLSIVEK